MNDGRANVRDSLLEAALLFVQSAARLSGVQRIALIGSILSDRPSPKDVDLLVYVADDADLAPLASAARRLQGRLQSQNRGADVFLADERRRYLGRTCSWKTCRPGVRASCDAVHCGRRPHLHDDLATIRLPDSLISAPPFELWPLVVRRCQVPADVERLVCRLYEPHRD
jgi:predicted nucleotidyltransferase